MHILCVDIGTGTQDILLFDSDREPENCLKMVMPSPTVLVAETIRQATNRGQDLLLTGFTMGGGPCQWAAEDHVQAGYNVFATPDAARTFNDDLDAVERTLGVKVVSEDDVGGGLASPLGDVCRIEMRDFYYENIVRAFASFGTQISLDAIAVAVFDHGAAPPDYSDRRFRFEYLAEKIQEERHLSAFAFMADDIPAHMTRMQAVANSIDLDLPLMLMDTAPAAVLGALEDPQAGGEGLCLVANIGNFHTLAFHLKDGQIQGVFEHHTSLLSQQKLEMYLGKLADGTVSNEEVFNDHGHGALVLAKEPRALDWLIITGPRRNLLRGSRLHPYFAAPYGDMMLAGCFGLVRAFAYLNPELAPAIEQALTPPPAR
ncbi:MAG: DUF1786 domain-containing protein [Anaerolineae bacterium]